MRTFALEFLGCKVNQYEMQALRSALLQLGLSESSPERGADLFVLNTCSVTHNAGATSRNRVRRMIRANAAAEVLVTGCYATSDRAVLAAMPGVSRVFGNDEKDSILGFVARELLGRDPEEPLPELRLTSLGDRTRAFVKIEDGCDEGCSFCIIPSLRGEALGRPEADVVREVEDLVREGCREVVLTGVHLGYYGKGQGPRGAPLLALLERLCAVPSLARLKLSSIEVQEVSDDLLDLMASREVFSPHFHIPLQSGSDAVLGRMRRRYRVARFLERVEAVRSRFERPALSTDVIVGFPGETDDDFDATMAACRAAGFMKIHVFPYSVREGTVAATLPDPVAVDTTERRKRRLLALDAAQGDAFRSTFLGQQVIVLAENRRTHEGLLTGLSERYVRVDFPGGEELSRALVPVRVVSRAVDGDALRGDVVDRVGVLP